MTGPGRYESYRDRLISAQAMSAIGGAEHRARVDVTDERGWWRGPFLITRPCSRLKTERAATVSGLGWRLSTRSEIHWTADGIPSQAVGATCREASVARVERSGAEKVSGTISCFPCISESLLRGDVRLHSRIAICVNAFSRARR